MPHCCWFYLLFSCRLPPCSWSTILRWIIFIWRSLSWGVTWRLTGLFIFNGRGTWLSCRCRGAGWGWRRGRICGSRGSAFFALLAPLGLPVSSLAARVLMGFFCGAQLDLASTRNCQGTCLIPIAKTFTCSTLSPPLSLLPSFHPPSSIFYQDHPLASSDYYRKHTEVS